MINLTNLYNYASILMWKFGCFNVGLVKSCLNEWDKLRNYTLGYILISFASLVVKTVDRIAIVIGLKSLI